MRARCASPRHYWERLPRTHFRLYHFGPAAPIVNIPNSSIYAFDTPNPVLRDVSLSVYPQQAWAVISKDAASGKAALFGALLGTHRISPPSPLTHAPSLTLDPHRHIQLVSFSHRGRGSGAGFYDFTARYGAVREEDKVTLRQTFFPDTAPPLHTLANALFEFLTEQLRLADLLDVPMIALSNGQTRRARIAKAFLAEPEPELLLLDEPLTGLDAKSREILLTLLQELNTRPDTPQVILGLREKDPLPEWTTHVALIDADGKVQSGPKQDVFPSASHPSTQPAPTSSPSRPLQRTLGEPLVDIKDVSIAYGPRRVLSSVRWTVHANSRWHLVGDNGAGKTTLLALLTGEHPQSYALSPVLVLLGRERAAWATPHLHRRIGRVSPELAAAFPRGAGLTVWDAVGTGFGGGFVPQGRRHEERWRLGRMRAAMDALGPARWHPRGASGAMDEAFWRRPFVELAPGEQAMVLLMRALVSAPPIVLLDEPWAGMDRAMVDAAHEYLRDGGGGLSKHQACIVVSHWDEEVPWDADQGVQRYKLESGWGRELL
ncbi:P-loop containing nucleoside triphosphate hydrolase protein [Epithele typhae]|uniref:P-loop containing nucleoside triphosphate hydrolase protein n=1 Tax=Epithele typhae TaxID=378194 RepID=UPI002007CC6B|nr:P-loop containing nucleoside triphosphate hydrolase protein [Epithele typhae]KAH9935118.1 P-loop containing nucleoside triphosphate hydrolase protein [Epithele typhae]